MTLAAAGVGTPSAATPAVVNFGVLGARSFVATRAVLPAIDDSPASRLVASASAGGDVPERWRVTDVGSYEAVIGHPEVQAVYVPLPNALHHDWVLRAARAGKHVLCEKPLAPDAATAAAMSDACMRSGVVLAEAWMTPFDPRWSAALEVARSGTVGPIHSIESTFTFELSATSPTTGATDHRWDPTAAGGALLDVGIYCVGAAVELWDAEPATVSAERVLGPTGVDVTTAFELRWPGGRVATGRCSFVEPEQQRLVLTGPLGRIVVDGQAFTGGPSATHLVVERWDDDGRPRTEHRGVTPADPYRRMVDEFAATVRDGRSWYRSSGPTIDLLDRIAGRDEP